MVQWGHTCLVDLYDTLLYRRVDVELVGMISYFYSDDRVEEAHVEMGPSSEWLVSHVDIGKRICNFFNGCFILSVNWYLLS